MNYKLENISHSTFIETLKKYLKEIEDLLAAEHLYNSRFEKAADLLIDKTESYIQNAIIPYPEDILYLLDNRYNDIFDRVYSAYRFDGDPKIQKEIERLNRFHVSFKRVIGYLQVIDTLIDPNATIEINNIPEKNDFLLTKLNQLFSEESYSIEQIFKLNNIPFRSSEPMEIEDDLYRRGYINSPQGYNSSSMLVQISVKGANYIERKNRSKKKQKSNSDLEKKLDNIFEHLTKLGYGQEIIFNEIGELKELQHTLSKKTWSQLLKGKLLDLALDKIISTETATFVYEYLTNSSVKLLKFP